MARGDDGEGVVYAIRVRRWGVLWRMEEVGSCCVVDLEHDGVRGEVGVRRGRGWEGVLFNNKARARRPSLGGRRCVGIATFDQSLGTSQTARAVERAPPLGLDAGGTGLPPGWGVAALDGRP